MPFIATGCFILGMMVAYVLFARTASKNANDYLADLEAAKALLDDAQEERAKLKQQVADLEYKLKEAEKDLAFEQSKK